MVKAATVQGTRTEPSEIGGQKVPRGMLTRSMFKDRANLTETEMRRLEQVGHVRAEKKTRKGWVLYSEAMLAEVLGDKPGGSVRIEYKSSEAASVFRLLKEGRALDDIVIETCCHPSVVKQIVRDFQSMTGCLFLSRSTVAQIEELDIDGPRPLSTQEALLELCVNAAKSLTCPCCRRRPKGLCAGCARQSIETRKASSTPAEGTASRPPAEETAPPSP